MKKIIALALMLLMLSSALAEGSLIVYFSHAWENYNVGVIEEGNTAKMAKTIAALTGAELFELQPVEAYPNEYEAALEVATAEQQANARPEYAGEVQAWEQYDTVFIGYPIWWGRIPNIVYTFMERYDFAGKTVVPFNTHEGSGQARTQQEIEQLLDSATVLQGLALTGSTAQNDETATVQAVSKWLSTIGLDHTEG